MRPYSFLPTLVKPLLNSKFGRTMKGLLCNAVSDYVYQTTYGNVKITRKGGLGFLRGTLGQPDPEAEFLSSLNLEGRIVYDIGGYVGLMSIFFAQRVKPAGQVIVFEPNSENCSKITEHLRLNGVENVRLLQLGIGDKKEWRSLVVVSDSSATGSMDEKMQSMMIKEHHFKQMMVPVETLDDAVMTFHLPPPDLIKIDIEGMEYSALLGAVHTLQAFSPSLDIEMHSTDNSSQATDICRIVELLASWDYSIRHIESLQPITLNNYQIVGIGHLFCTRPCSPILAHQLGSLSAAQSH